MRKRRKDNPPKVTEKHFLGSQENDEQESSGAYRQVTMKEMKSITNQGKAQKHQQSPPNAWHPRSFAGCLLHDCPHSVLGRDTIKQRCMPLPCAFLCI